MPRRRLSIMDVSSSLPGVRSPIFAASSLSALAHVKREIPLDDRTGGGGGYKVLRNSMSARLSASERLAPNS
jgi:hypothetical protein